MKKKRLIITLIIILVLSSVLAGAYYYRKIYIPKKEEVKSAIVDENNNKIDDSKDYCEVKYMIDGIDSESVKYNSKYKTPQLKLKDKVIINWYFDKEFKEVVKDNFIIKTNVELHPKIADIKDVVKECINTPLTSESTLEPIKQSINEYNIEAEKKYLTDIEERVKEEENKSLYKKAANDTNITINKILSNPNEPKILMLTFNDNNGQYLYSIPVKYNKLIKVYSKEGTLVKEFSARQNANYVLNFTDSEVKVDTQNTTQYIKIIER